jgi:hypothetical protein
MYNIRRVAALCLVLLLASAPLPAFAQGSSSNSLAVRVQALEAAVAKLMGNITADDLVGTYSVYLLGIAMDPPGTQATYNQMSSYVNKGTATLAANFRGTLNGTGAGIVMTEQAANLNWTNVPVSVSGTGDFSWSYSSGVLTVTMDPGVPFNDFDLSVIAGGQALVSAFGGAPSNNQQILILVRQP